MNTSAGNWGSTEDNNNSVWGKNKDKKDEPNTTSNWGTSNEQTSTWGNTEQPSSTQNKEQSNSWGEIKKETKEQSSWGINDSNLGFESSNENKNSNAWGTSLRSYHRPHQPSYRQLQRQLCHRPAAS